MPRSNEPSHVGRHPLVVRNLMRGRDLDGPAREPRRDGGSFGSRVGDRGGEPREELDGAQQ